MSSTRMFVCRIRLQNFSFKLAYKISHQKGVGNFVSQFRRGIFCKRIFKQTENFVILFYVLIHLEQQKQFQTKFCWCTEQFRFRSNIILQNSKTTDKEFIKINIFSNLCFKPGSFVQKISEMVMLDVNLRFCRSKRVVTSVKHSFFM